MAAISVPVQVTNGAGRTGVCVYDNAAVTDDSHASAYVIYSDNTWDQVPRNTLTTLPDLPEFFTGTGPGQ